MRLNQWLVRAGAAEARRKADDLIAAGKVQVNGAPGQLGYHVEDGDVVTLDGKVLELQEVSGQVLLFNKPVGLVCSHKQQGKVPTIFDVLPAEYHTWKIVGRLDKDSDGLVILSDDGQVAQSLAHPSRGESKLYEIELDRPLAESDKAKLVSGVQLEEGLSQFLSVAPVTNAIYKVELQTGWNRQIRRACEELGYIVTRITRLRLGRFELGDLLAGQWRLEDNAL